MPPKRKTSPKKDKEAPEGLSWPGFRSWYKEENGNSEGVSDAWEKYKKKYGIVPKVSAKKKVSSPKEGAKPKLKKGTAKRGKKSPTSKKKETDQPFQYILHIQDIEDTEDPDDISPKSIAAYWKGVLKIFKYELDKKDIELDVLEKDTAQLTFAIKATPSIHKNVTPRVKEIVDIVNDEHPQFVVELEVIMDAGREVKKPGRKSPKRAKAENQRTILLSIDTNEKVPAFNGWSKFSNEFSNHIGDDFVYTLDSVKDDVSLRELTVPDRKNILTIVKKAVTASNKKLTNKVNVLTGKEQEEKVSARKKSPEIEENRAKVTINTTVGEFDDEENELVDLSKALSPQEKNEVIEAIKTTLDKNISYIDHKYRGANFTIRYYVPKGNDNEIRRDINKQLLPGNGTINGNKRTLGFFMPEIVNIERGRTPTPTEKQKKKPLPAVPPKKTSPTREEQKKKPLPAKPPAKKKSPTKTLAAAKSPPKGEYLLSVLLARVSKSGNVSPVEKIDFDTSQTFSNLIEDVINAAAGKNAVLEIREITEPSYEYSVKYQSSVPPEEIIIAFDNALGEGIKVDRDTYALLVDTDKFNTDNDYTLELKGNEKKQIQEEKKSVEVVKSKSRSRSPVKPTKSRVIRNGVYELSYPVSARVGNKGDRYEDVGDTLTEAEIQTILDFVNSHQPKDVQILNITQDGNTIIIDAKPRQGKTKMTKDEVEKQVSRAISGKRIQGDSRVLKL